MKNSVEKDLVRGYWDEKSCGEVMIVGDEIADGLAMAAEERYRLEPYIHDFADFPSGRDKDILEIGVGMGADHVEWARHEPCSLTGLDLTQRAIEFAGRNLAANGLSSALQIGDAENLPFCDDVFDIVYSWGVLHHSPDTPKAIREVWRVLKPGGAAKVMIYHRRSMVGFMLWLRYALMTGKPEARTMLAHRPGSHPARHRVRRPESRGQRSFVCVTDRRCRKLALL